MAGKQNSFDRALKDIGKFVGDAAQTVGKAAEDVGNFVGKTAGDVGEFVGKTATNVGTAVGKTAGDVGGFIGKTASNVGTAANDAWMALDANGDGVVDITDIIIMALRTPGIKVNRSAFLRNELKKSHNEETIVDAIETNPMHAGISPEEINKITNAVIAYERNCVSGISTALGMPGGVAMVATIPADILQFYGYTLRAAQKLMYLYGFPEIMVDENGINIDTETINELIVCLGTMFGVASANNALKAMAKMLGNGVQKQLMKKALTKGAIYPIVKQTAKWFGVKMTKEVFTGFFKKAIPVVGGVLGGAITFASFGPCCNRLVKVLQDTALSNPNYKADVEVEKIYTEFTVDTNDETMEKDDKDEKRQ